MKNNIFTFSDTFWLQKTGTAMGTPCACMIATLYFGFHERELILSKYKHNILYYKRYIDDVICLWLPSNTSSSTSDPTYLQLQNDMNSFGQLKWEFETLCTTTIFLDLHITLIPRNSNNTLSNVTPSSALHSPPLHSPLTVKFKTHQKSLNLYLYIPPHSAHPPGVLRSLIHGLLRKYWIQNSDTVDFQNITKLLFQRLCDRGHNPHQLYPLFVNAAKSIDSKQIQNSIVHTPSSSTHNNIFLKWRYHPDGVTRKDIQKIYKSTCENTSDNAPHGFRHLPTTNGATLHISKLTIAYTRDRNLRDILIPSRLPFLQHQNASDLIPTHPPDT